MDCSWCGLGLPADHVTEGVVMDHIIPKSRGGPNAPWNMQLLHAVCNIRKSDKMTPAAEALALAHRVQLHEPTGRLRHRLRSQQPYTTRPKTPSYTTRPEVREIQRITALPPTLAELMAVCDEVLGTGLRVSGLAPLHDYEQIAEQLRRAIKSGKITQKLPSVSAIAREAGVAPGTAQRALNILAREKLIYSVKRVGTFVRSQG